MFGQQQTPGPFGNLATPGTSLFGATTPAPAAAAQNTNAGFSFGTTPAAKPTFSFGSTPAQPTTTAAPASFSFGQSAPAAASAAAPSGTGTAPSFSFGQAAPTQATFSFSKPATGATTTASAPFGATTSNAMNPAFSTATATSNAPVAAPLTDPNTLITLGRTTWPIPVLLQRLSDTYNVQSPHYAFRHLFYNIVAPHDVARYQRPATMDEKTWNDAMEDRPDPLRMIPVQACGFSDLEKRSKAQQQQFTAQRAKCQELEQSLRELEQKRTLFQAQIVSHQKRLGEQMQRLLQVMAAMTWLQTRGLPWRQEEETLRQRIEKLHQLPLGQIEEWEAQWRQWKPQITNTGMTFLLDAKTEQDLMNALEQQQKGLNALVKVLQEDAQFVQQTLKQ